VVNSLKNWGVKLTIQKLKIRKLKNRGGGGEIIKIGGKFYTPRREKEKKKKKISYFL